MNKTQVFAYLFLALYLSCCSSAPRQKEQQHEVSNYISNHISEIPIYIDNNHITVNLINAASAEKILLHFISQPSFTSSLNNLTIKCLSQCGIEFVGDSGKTQIKNLHLINAHLLTNSQMKVENIFINASEAIRTGLPIVSKEAHITISSSPNMLTVRNLLKGVNIIPASGEFVYDTKIVYDKDNKAINSHNDKNIADAAYNIETLVHTFPNLKWAAPVVSWFAFTKNYDNKNNLDVSQLEIMPGIEGFKEASEIWNSGKYTRKNAYLISKDHDNRPNYGGTINDTSLVRYIESLRNEKLKIMFYPMVLMDLPNKPWRGFVKANNPDDIHNFFTKDKGYNQFILHYANLLKGKIDAFVIGSEMQDLTQSEDSRYSYGDSRRFPAVVEFIALAKQVKEILGDKVTITYAANWGEYHHDKNKFHHLDPLWTSPDIDVVGIDAYLPITNKSMGDISIQEIKQGWSSGELWNYYYDRNKKTDIPPEWGLKQIEFWWENEHWSKGIKTSWKPKMKPIWFTEFGFPSMHMATNTPNVFWNPKSTSGNVPKKSSGKPDFAIQMRAIQGTLEYWQQKSNIVQNMFLWSWDARPFPYYPKRIDIWSDGDVWSRGHWVNGKVTPLKQVRLLDNTSVNILKINADKLVIEGSGKGINVINAKDVEYIP